MKINLLTIICLLITFGSVTNQWLEEQNQQKQVLFNQLFQDQKTLTEDQQWNYNSKRTFQQKNYTYVTLSKNGTTMVIVTANNQILVYTQSDNKDMMLKQTFPYASKTGIIKGISLSDDQSYLYVLGSESSIVYYKQTSKSDYIFIQNISSNNSFEFISDKIVTKDGSTMVLIKQRKPVIYKYMPQSKTYQIHDQLQIIADKAMITSKGDYIILLQYNRFVTLLKSQQGYCIQQNITDSEFTIYAIDFTDDLQYLVTGGYGGILRIYRSNLTQYVQQNTMYTILKYQSIEQCPRNKYVIHQKTQPTKSHINSLSFSHQPYYLAVASSTIQIYIHKNNVFQHKQTLNQDLQGSLQILFTDVKLTDRGYMVVGLRENIVKAYFQCKASHCDSCLWIDSCKTCKYTFQLNLNNSCVCPSNYTLSNIQQCVSCNTKNCIRCDEPDKCTQCSESATKSIVDNECALCSIKDCLRCDADNYCALCRNSKTPGMNGHCFSCSIDYCVRCDADNYCSKCKEGFDLLAEMKCNCRSGRAINTNKDCIQCSISNCQKCQKPNVCAQCRYYYNEANGQCSLIWWLILIIILSCVFGACLVVVIIIIIRYFWKRHHTRRLDHAGPVDDVLAAILEGQKV